MPKLAVFGDEIAKPIDTQIEVMLSEGIRALELRAAEGVGVLDLAGEQRETVKAKLDDAGIEVFSIGSPIGKVPIEDPVEAEQLRLETAIEQAHFFGAPRIRVFSFFVPAHERDAHREKVVERLAAFAEMADNAGVRLCHENESRIYGETVAACRDLLESIDSPAFRAVHDTANFVTHHEEPFPAGYEAVKPWLEYVHIKDKQKGGDVQPAGEGDGRFPEFLRQLKEDGFDGYLSLEPHIGGGPDNFRRAARALKKLLTELDWNYT